jgi:hypothetical protein
VIIELRGEQFSLGPVFGCMLHAGHNLIHPASQARRRFTLADDSTAQLPGGAAAVCCMCAAGAGWLPARCLPGCDDAA